MTAARGGDRSPDDEPLRVVVGPTGAGKSAVVMRLAERRPLLVISADSRQVYRGFDLGTAKPSPAERARVPHRGIDVAEPTVRYSAAAWSGAADAWVDEARSLGLTPVVVGGTGLYIRALVAPFFEEPELDRDRRNALERVTGTWPLSELERWVSVLDPPRAHLGRTQLLRAIEVALLTGRRLSDLHVSNARPPRRTARYLVVDPGPRLEAQIRARARTMLESGWPDEVRALAERVPAGAPAWNASGYEAVRRLVAGELTAEETLELIVIETRQYAKRQRTWFRHQLPAADVTTVDPGDPDCLARLERWWEGAS